MNIYLHELRSYRKSTLIWTLTIVLLTIVFMLLYPTYKRESAVIMELFKGLPPELLKGFGMNLDIFFTVLGFYAFPFLYIQLCGALQAMNLGVSVLSKEISQKTADFLLTKPISRVRVMTAKLLAILTSIGITNIIFLAVASIMLSLVADSPFDYQAFFMLSITMFLVQIMFISFGVLYSVIATRIKSVTAVSMTTVFGFFFINMLANSLDDTKMRYLSPFGYFLPNNILQDKAYEGSFVIVALLLVIFAVAVSYLIYSKKDIHAL